MIYKHCHYWDRSPWHPGDWGTLHLQEPNQGDYFNLECLKICDAVQNTFLVEIAASRVAKSQTKWEELETSLVPVGFSSGPKGNLLHFIDQ